MIPPLDINALRRDYPLSSIAGAVMKLQAARGDWHARMREAAGHCYQCLVDVFDRRGCKGVSAGSR